MINNKLHTTAGVKDYLPEECALKNKIEEKIKYVFDKYNYKCVITPTFEFEEVYYDMGGADRKRMYKFLDRDGSILALRPDVTPAIARIAATAYDKEDLPLRFSYVGNAFRYNENYQGKLREFTQAGAELIGVNSIEADAEAIMLAVNSLIAVGIEDFRVDIANVDFLKGVLEEANIDQFTQEKIIDGVVAKNYVEVNNIARELKISEKLKRLFYDLPLLIGDISMLDAARELVKNERSISALDYMARLYELLKGCGYEKYISFDLSVTGHFDYYTGIVFRAYTKGTGFSVIDGGRYDKLSESFGASYPAVGLAVKINDIMTALENTKGCTITSKADVLAVFTERGRQSALKKADELRRDGKRVEVSLVGSDIEKNRVYACKNNISEILFFDGETAQSIKVTEAE